MFLAVRPCFSYSSEALPDSPKLSWTPSILKAERTVCWATSSAIVEPRPPATWWSSTETTAWVSRKAVSIVFVERFNWRTVDNTASYALFWEELGGSKCSETIVPWAMMQTSSPACNCRLANCKVWCLSQTWHRQFARSNIDWSRQFCGCQRHLIRFVLICWS